MNGLRTIPRVNIRADGTDLGAQQISGLGELRVQQRLSLPTLCELAFFSPPGPVDTVANLSPGTGLIVTVEGVDTPLFVGEVTVVEHVYGPTGDRELRVRAYDRLHRLRKTHSVRTHVEVSVSTLAEELAGAIGATLVRENDGAVRQSVVQFGQSDLDLLAVLAESSGLYFTLRGDRLHLLTLQGVGEPQTLVLGETLVEARIEVSGEASSGSVEVTGWNPLEVQEYTAQAGRARVGRSVAAHVSADSVGADMPRRLVGTTVEAHRHAEMLAQAELDRSVARAVVFWGVADGDARLRPGTPIDVQGVTEDVAGQYVLTSVTHTLDGEKGFLSELSTIPPGPRSLASGATHAFGVVTQVDDPEGLGRVRVSLPSYGGVETGWLQVLSTGGGGGKGLLMLPDVQDKVLVLLSPGDPAMAVVLGGLFGMDGSPDSGVEGGAVRRYSLRSAGGQRLQIDDTHGILRLENSDGSFVELSPDRVQIHSARDLEIAAPGRAVVIRGHSIDFERA